MSDYDISVASTRGYASLLKKIDKWTPYVGYAFLRPAQFLLRRPGKVIEVDGVRVTAVTANAGSETRNHFLHVFLNQDEDRYTARTGRYVRASARVRVARRCCSSKKYSAQVSMSKNMLVHKAK
jgi:hypothetical protein